MQGMVMCDVIELTALVLTGHANRNGSLFTKIWTSAKERAEEHIHNVGEGYIDWIGEAICFRIVPAKKRIPGLAGANRYGVLVKTQIFQGAAFKSCTVTSNDPHVVAMWMEWIIGAAYT